MLIVNTTNAQGIATLAIPTVPGKYYATNYLMQVVQVAQINMSAKIDAGVAALNFCANQVNTWFKFRAQSTVTYLQIKVSTSTLGDMGTIGPITVQVGVPDLISDEDWSTSSQTS